jgi:tRNA-splicing ligase RtcB
VSGPREEAPTVREWLAGPPPADVRQAIDRLSRVPGVRRVAVMPDVHLAEPFCVGMVVATADLVYPHAVGSDIGCGMAAIRFHCEADRVADARVAARLLAGFERRIPAIRHPAASAPAALPEELGARALSHPRLEALKRRDGRVELATLGRGNHFLELQRCEEGRLWLMLHSGSRAMGRAILEHHHGLHDAGSAAPFGLAMGTPECDAYLADADWALAYAEASRRSMVAAAADVVASVLGCAPEPATLVTCHHNHVRREHHGGEELLVHRKGAIHVPAGALGIVPGSMGSPSFHVAGRGCPEALDSSAHGAGRLLSRTEARKSVSVRDLERQMHGIWFDHRAADRLRDEAPSAYKDVTAVMRAQRDLVRIVRRLDPLLSYKAT